MKTGLLLAFFLAGTMTGCVVEPGYDEDEGYGDTYESGPEFYIFGDFGHGHSDRDAGHRGFESRREAHHSEGPGGRPGGHQPQPSHGGQDHQEHR